MDPGLPVHCSTLAAVGKPILGTLRIVQLVVMSLIHPEPALLVFTLGPHREQLRRGLLPRRLQGAERLLHQRSLESVLDSGRSSGCECWVAAPGPLTLAADVEQIEQTGRTFGERLQGSIDQVWKSSQDRPIVVVGTDCPELSESHLQEALRLLAGDPDRVVIGPATDGGFNLLAFSRPVDVELSRVRWCRGDTLKCLLAALLESGRPVTLLAPLNDLDHQADLERWLAARTSLQSGLRWFHRWLRSLLSELRRPPVPLVSGLPLPAFARPSRGRSPPY